MDHQKFLQSLDSMLSDSEVSSVSSNSSEMAGPELAKMAGEDGKPLPAGTIAKLVSTPDSILRRMASWEYGVERF